MALHSFLSVLLITSIAAMGSLIGAFAAFIIIRRHRKLHKTVLQFIVALGGGLLLSAIILVLIPQGLNALSLLWTTVMFMAGSIVFMLIDLWIESKGESASQLLANTMDSLPESIGIGAAFASAGTVGLLLGIIVGLQNIAEGFNSYNELHQAKTSNKTNFILQLLCALSCPIGGVLGFLFLAGHPTLIAALFMFSAGGILYLIFHDIAPLAHKEGHWVPTLGAGVGVVFGLISQALVG